MAEIRCNNSTHNLDVVVGAGVVATASMTPAPQTASELTTQLQDAVQTAINAGASASLQEALAAVNS